MAAELLAWTDARWPDLLREVPHDFYHLPAYVDLCARREGGTAAALWAEDGRAALLAPVVLRPLPGDLAPDPRWRDAQAPYGYPGPLLRGNPDGDRAAALLRAARAAAAAAGVVSAFLRLHPLLPVPEGLFEGNGTLVDHGWTVYVDLRLPAEELARQTRANHLADVRRLERAGFALELDCWERLDGFAAIYRETMRLHAAGADYLFGPDYFHDLRRCLGSCLHLAEVRAPDGTTACAGLFTAVDGLVQFHLSGTAPAHRRSGSPKMMLVGMRDWAKARGDHTLHLGGGVGCREDSLAFFKQGFSHLRCPFRTFRMVPLPEAYRDLTRRHPAPLPGDPEGFFPAYRCPHPAADPGRAPVLTLERSDP